MFYLPVVESVTAKKNIPQKEKKGFKTRKRTNMDTLFGKGGLVLAEPHCLLNKQKANEGARRQYLRVKVG